VLASLRAELLVLRKSKVAWVLVLTAPLLTLVSDYLFGFLRYLGDTPAMYLQEGNPGQALAGLLPNQFVINAAEQLTFTAPFIVLGAVIAGGDWSRGTIKTSLLAGPSRTRAFAGQALAIVIACAVSVVACFVIAALASFAIRWYSGATAPGAFANDAFPSLATVSEGVGAGLVIGTTYGALGIALGVICRSAAGGIVAALGWYALVDVEFYQLSLNGGPLLQHLYNAFPEASVITLTSMFGSSGGGASSATYQPVGHWAAAAILLGYAVIFLGLALLLIRRRDVISTSGTRFTWARLAWARPAQWRLRPGEQQPEQSAASPDSVPATGVLACARAELLVMSRWPAMRALVLVVPVLTLFNGYVNQYLLYRAGNTAVSLNSPSQVLTTMLPGQYVPAVLNSIGFGSLLPGTAAFFLIGALVSGSSWGGRTITTSLLQGPARAAAVIGQALAVAAALVASVVLTFAVAGVCAAVIAVITSASISPAAGPLPGAGQLAGGFAVAVLVSLAWGAVGWTAGTAAKTAAGAFAVMLLWTTILQGQLDYYATLMPKAARVVYDVLPDAATNTVALLYGQVDYAGPGFDIGEVAAWLAFITLATYALACFTIPVIVTRRRDIV
jgi:ABC-type transport system involved in multi-copper enzyme maturation permease subunit